MTDPTGMAERTYTDGYGGLLNATAAIIVEQDSRGGSRPEGKNFYFSSEGDPLGTGKGNDEIRIVNSGFTNSPSDYADKSEVFSGASLTEEAVGKIGQYFLKEVLEISEDIPVRGLINAPFIFAALTNRDGSAESKLKEGVLLNDPVISFSMLDRIDGSKTMSTSNFDNWYNFASTLYHEHLHFISKYSIGNNQFIGGFSDGNDLGRSNHLNVYWMQVNHPLYQYTTPSYQRNTNKFINTYIKGVGDMSLKNHYQNLFSGNNSLKN